MSAIVGVDVGGSGLRLMFRYAGRLSSVLTAPGARTGERGVDVGALVADASRLLRDGGVGVADGLAAVDEELPARGVGRVVAGQEEHHAGDLFGLTDPGHRLMGEQFW